MTGLARYAQPALDDRSKNSSPFSCVICNSLFDKCLVPFIEQRSHRRECDQLTTDHASDANTVQERPLLPKAHFLFMHMKGWEHSRSERSPQVMVQCFIDRGHGAPAIRHWNHSLISSRFSERLSMAIDCLFPVRGSILGDRGPPTVHIRRAQRKDAVWAISNHVP